MASKKKIYDVRWQDDDGEQAYFVGMTKDEADQVERFLASANENGKIKDPSVEPLQGDRVLSKAQLLTTFKNRHQAR